LPAGVREPADHTPEGRRRCGVRRAQRRPRRRGEGGDPAHARCCAGAGDRAGTHRVLRGAPVAAEMPALDRLRGRAAAAADRQALQALAARSVLEGPQDTNRLIRVQDRAMQEFYDASEARAPELREREQFAKMPELIARAMGAPGWAEHLAGVEAKSVASRAALAALPVLRKSDLKD